MALHTKHRPDTWSSLIGQTTVKIILESEIANGMIAHAYLFCGPRGVGKTTVARLLAKTVNCTGRAANSSEPCNACFNCRAFKAGNALDVIEIDAASHTGVEHVREHIIENLRFTPHSSQYKVFIIDEVHMLSASAFNALLKTLEEPPAHVIFILATTEMHKVPATILSRCQIFQFKKLTTDEIVERLTVLAERENVKTDVEILREVARVSEGSLRDAESLLGQIFSIATDSADGKYKNVSAKQARAVIPESYFGSVLEFLQYVQARNASAAIRYVNMLLLEGKDLAQFLNNTIEFLRKLLLLKISDDLNEFAVEFDKEVEEKVHSLASIMSNEEILRLMNIALEEKNSARHAVVESMPLELVVMKFVSDGGNYRVINTPVSPEVKPVKKVSPTPEPKVAPPPLSEASVVTAEPPIVSTVAVITPEKPATVELPPVSVAAPLILSTIAPIDPPMIEFEQVLLKWNTVLERLEDVAPSIPLMLRTAKPIGMDNAQIKVGLKYKFHADRLNIPKTRGVINQILAEIYGFPLTLEALCMPEIEGPSDNTPMVNTILEQFGGQVI